MNKKKVLVILFYFCLLGLVACGPKTIDDADLVSVQYYYSVADWSVVGEWVEKIEIWGESEFSWMESFILWARKGDIFTWTLNGVDLYWGDYDKSLVQNYSSLVMKEVYWVSNPEVWMKVFVDEMWEWVIIAESKDDEWYSVYAVDFNNPKTYSELLYYVKILNVEKN